MDGTADGSSILSAIAVDGAIGAALGVDRAPSAKTIIFFSQDISDVSTIKRVQQFLARDFAVTVFGFRRDRYNFDFRPPWRHVLLGYTEDSRYLRRVRALLAAVPVLWRERVQLADASVFYARNIDQLALALLAKLTVNRRASVFYEVLDIQPAFARRGILSLILRLTERALLSRIRYLVLSSPGFFRHYYAPVQGYTGAWVLLENKLPSPILPSRPAVDENLALGYSRRRWTVGYFGLIRGQSTFDLIVQLARRLGDRVHFKFHGVLTTVDERSFHEALHSCPNISYGGPFENPDDLAELYGSVDFAWALDLENADHNSRWLLPCRLYEAGYFGVPCLTVRDFELGRLIERRGIGWAFDAPFEDAIVRFFDALTAADYLVKRRRLMAMPEDAFVASHDIEALCRVIADPEWAFDPPAASGGKYQPRDLASELQS